MSEAGRISASLEDYLEAIASLSVGERRARPSDIAETLSVHRSTVTAALHSLADKGLIDYAPYQSPTLTGQGRRLAADVIHRHGVLKRFLTGVLGVGERTAGETACRLEHAIDADVLDRLLEFVESCEA